MHQTIKKKKRVTEKIWKSKCDAFFIGLNLTIKKSTRVPQGETSSQIDKDISITEIPNLDHKAPKKEFSHTKKA